MRCASLRPPGPLPTLALRERCVNEAESSQARVFVGADRSQLMAVRVLEFSIARRTKMPVVVRSMHDLALPSPKDARQQQRTGFSFTRFAIPELAGYQGRALYLDADMLVLRDLRELYDLPFNGAKVLIQDEPPQFATHWGGGKRIKQCSVMLLDCAALGWLATDIIAGLDGQYTYEQLIYDLCILKEQEVGFSVPFEWNSLETYEPGRTGLIHYTDMSTQPWVSARNPNGFLWINEVRAMLDAGALTLNEIQEEVRLGFFRPSILLEIQDAEANIPPSAARTAAYEAHDRRASFAAHASVRAAQRERLAANASRNPARVLSSFGKRAWARIQRESKALLGLR